MPSDSSESLDCGPPSLQRQPSYDKAVGEVSDTAMLGVEIDVQVGQMTLRSKHLSALQSTIARYLTLLQFVDLRQLNPKTCHNL